MIFECENVTLGYENKIVTSNLSFTIDMRLCVYCR